LDGEEDVVRNVQRYIKFIAGTDLAAPMSQLSQIIELPRDLNPCPRHVPGLMGLFLSVGHMTPLVDMASYLGLTNESAERAGGPSEQKLILTGVPGHRVGYLVQSIDGIGTSQWRSVDKRGQDLVRPWRCNLNLCVPPSGFGAPQLRNSGPARAEQWLTSICLVLTDR
jgi:chemotaxis signal transduction protein